MKEDEIGEDEELITEPSDETLQSGQVPEGEVIGEPAGDQPAQESNESDEQLIQE